MPSVEELVGYQDLSMTQHIRTESCRIDRSSAVCSPQRIGTERLRGTPLRCRCKC